MASTEKSPFSAEHIAEFNRIQALRRVLLRRMTDAFEAYRDCANPACRRARGCQRDDGACLTAIMRAMPESERRLFRHAIENRLAGLAPEEALRRAAVRVEEEEARLAAQGFGRAAGTAGPGPEEAPRGA